MKLFLSHVEASLSDVCVYRPEWLDKETVFTSVVIDSRQVVPGSLFVALKGERVDGHDFLQDAFKAGAKGVVVEKLPDESLQHNGAVFVVSNTEKALGQIAHYWRRQHQLCVIAVLGSNGKTTVKEMIASILKAHFGESAVLATAGNFNNGIGVPLTLFRLTSMHQVAVLELGMNHPGEIAYLTELVEPTIVLINNAQREHQEFMQSVEAVAQENGAAILGLSEEGVAIFPGASPYTHMWKNYAGKRAVYTFDLLPLKKESTSGLSLHHVCGTYMLTKTGSQLTVEWFDRPETIVDVPVMGAHNAYNALAAITVCGVLNCSLEAIGQGLLAFQGAPGRLIKKAALYNVTVIDDTYNANPDSVKVAIDVLAKCHGEKILVLGDMGEVGSHGKMYHQEVGEYAKQNHIQCLYTLGQLSAYSTHAFGEGALHFDEINQLLAALSKKVQPHTTVLVKGSRFMKMERVVDYLLMK